MTVVDERSLFGKKQGFYISEYLQVSNQSAIDGNYYYVILREAPGVFPEVSANIIVSTSSDPTSTTAHLTEKKDSGSVGPQVGEYRVEGQRVYFPASQAGLSFWFYYYGIGSIVKSQDINELDSRVTTLESGSGSGGGSSQYDWFILDQIKQTYG